jgi:N-acetylglucosamine kinase-like BadF-type ATPase
MDVVVGLDMGASKTACVVADLYARPLSVSLAGPANPNIVGLGGVFLAFNRALSEALTPLTSFSPVIRAVCLGVAGLEADRRKHRLEALVRRGLDGSPVVLTHTDASVALLGAFAGNPGVLVIAGTGSVVLGRNAKGQAGRTGGFGFLLGDEGSGFDLGRKGMQAALRSVDGTGPETRLPQALMAFYGIEDPSGVLPLVYRSRSRVDVIARFAPEVLSLGFEGDMVAERIVREGAEGLLRALEALVRKLQLQEAFSFATAGGLFRNEAFLEMFLRTVKSRFPDAKPVQPLFPPEMGAAFLALEALGLSPFPQEEAVPLEQPPSVAGSTWITRL